MSELMKFPKGKYEGKLVLSVLNTNPEYFFGREFYRMPKQILEYKKFMFGVLNKMIEKGQKRCRSCNGEAYNFVIHKYEIEYSGGKRNYQEIIGVQCEKCSLDNQIDFFLLPIKMSSVAKVKYKTVKKKIVRLILVFIGFSNSPFSQFSAKRLHSFLEENGKQENKDEMKELLLDL